MLFQLRFHLVEEKKRELATNRLLDVIRNGKSSKSGKKPETPEKETVGDKTFKDLTPTQQRLVKPPTMKKPPEDSEGAPRLLDRLLTDTESEPHPSTDKEPKKRKKTLPTEKPLDETPPAFPKIEAVVEEQLPPPGLLKKLTGMLPKKSARPQTGKSKTVKTKRKTKRVIVVDIGTSSIKVVEINKSETTNEFIQADSRPIPSSLRKNENSLKILQLKILHDLLPPQRTKGAKIYFVLGDSSMQLKRVGLPVVPEKERVNAIKFQIKKELPFPLDSCEVSYRGWNPKVNIRQEVEVLAADNRRLEKITALIDELDILPHYISVIPASLRHLVKAYTDTESNQGAIAVVDVGAIKTTITIIEKEKLVLCRTIATGGDDFTQVLQRLELGPDGVDLSEAEAEKYKIELGLPPEGKPATMSIHIQFRPVVERISTEINRSLDFYRRERPEGDLQKVIMIGGGSKMKNLPEFLGHNLGMDTILGCPQDWIEFPPDDGEDESGAAIAADPAYAPAFALALDNGVDLNLLPQHIKSALKMMSIKRTIPPIVLGVMALFISLYALALIELEKVEIEAETITGQIVNLDKYRKQYMAIKVEFDQKTTELNGRDSDFASVKIGIPDIPMYIKALSNLVPPNIYLTRMHTLIIPEEDIPPPKAGKKETEETEKKEVDMEKILAALQGEPEEEEEAPPPKPKRLIFGRVIEIEGCVYPMGSLTDMQLVNFVFSMENSGYFREIAVDSAATASDGRLQFKVICGI